MAELKAATTKCEVALKLAEEASASKDKEIASFKVTIETLTSEKKSLEDKLATAVAQADTLNAKVRDLEA